MSSGPTEQGVPPLDMVALGEVMLRLDPGEGRVRTARSFTVWEGGGEYNVARGLRRCFGLRTAVVTALVRNEVGLLLEDLILQGGVDSTLIHWLDFDGTGRAARNGLNFTERGFGVRGALGVSDRANTAASQLRPADVDWELLFSRGGLRWFHTGGIFAALSESTAAVAEVAMVAARAAGVKVSFDLNYRPSLWQSQGGIARAQEVCRRLVPMVDVLLGNEEDFTACLGYNVPDSGGKLSDLDPRAFTSMIATVAADFPALDVIATTFRGVRSASINDWGAVAWSRTEGVVEATHRQAIEILDRVGGGDSFASGLIFGLLSGRSLKDSVELGAAHGALAMTTPGDNSSATLAEVERLAAGGGARVVR